jgi:3-oxoacyl-[acyl-carrier-protein] synthase-3
MPHSSPSDNRTEKNVELPPVYIRGTGSYAPAKVVTNDDLAQFVDTSDEWIFTRTGIRSRRFASAGETTSFMAIESARRAMAAAQVPPEAIDLVIVATITPDMPFPSTACLVQHALGLGPITAFDIQAACSGFLYALRVGTNMIRSGDFKHALVIGAETMSSVLDFEDRSTCVLFGDGAGAVVLSAEKSSGANGAILGTLCGADGSNPSLLCVPGGGSACPASADSIAARQHFLKMNGREIFKVAVRAMEQCSRDILQRCGRSADDLDCVIPHQANMRIIDAIASRLELPPERFFNNLEQYGNTSAASIPIALDEAVRAGRLKNDDLLLLVGFGAGLTWAASLIEWNL